MDEMHIIITSKITIGQVIFYNITSSVQKCYQKYVKLFTSVMRVCRSKEFNRVTDWLKHSPHAMVVYVMYLCNAQWESTASTEVIEILLLWILCNSYMIPITHFGPLEIKMYCKRFVSKPFLQERKCYEYIINMKYYFVH
jgi:hypothetical protein